MDAIRVLIVDDHPTYSLGVKVLLEQEDDIILIGIAKTVDEGVALTIKESPDVLLLDMILDIGSDGGAEVARQLREKGSDVKILGISQDPELVKVLGPYKPHGFILKTDASIHILGAIREVAAGNPWYSPSLPRRFEDPADIFTERELKVIQLMAGEHKLGTHDIAKELSITEKRVQAMISSAVHKVADQLDQNVYDRTSLVAWAWWVGIVKRQP